MTNYNRSHIKNYAEIAFPLYNLLKDDTVWKWTDDCEEAFNDLKQRLASYPILRIPDPEREFVLHADASDVAMGAALSQHDDEGKEYAVDYQSQNFKGAERHMSISEKELAAIILGVKKNAHFLYGKKFKIITDHSALQYLISLKNPTGRLD